MVVNVEHLLSRLPEKQQTEISLRKEFDRIRKQVDKEFKDIERLNQEFDQKRAALSAQRAAEMQDDLIRKEKKLSEKWNQAAAQMKARTEEVAQQFSHQIERAILRYAKELSVDLVFEKTSGKLIYASPAMDRTTHILDRVLAVQGPAKGDPK